MHNHHKILKFILGNKKTDNIDNNNLNYNFETIDLDGNFSIGGNGILNYCVTYRKVEIVSLLIDHPNMTKELINQTNPRGRTPLHHAFMKTSAGDDDQDSSLKIDQMLINDKRTDINIVSGEGKTALMYAIESYPKIAMTLIDNERCNVNIQATYGDTAFHIFVETAALCNLDTDATYLQLCQKLLQRKDLDSNIRNNQAKTPLDLAKEKNLSAIVKLIAKCEKK